MADVTTKTESASNQGQTAPTAGAPAIPQNTQSAPLEVSNSCNSWQQELRTVQISLLTPVLT